MFQVCLVFPSLVLFIYSVFCPLFPVGCYMSFGVCLTLFSLFPELIIKSIVKITPRLLVSSLRVPLLLVNRDNWPGMFTHTRNLL